VRATMNESDDGVAHACRRLHVFDGSALAMGLG
jgi:hypothetical protein